MLEPWIWLTITGCVVVICLLCVIYYWPSSQAELEEAERSSSEDLCIYSAAGAALGAVLYTTDIAYNCSPHLIWMFENLLQRTIYYMPDSPHLMRVTSPSFPTWGIDAQISWQQVIRKDRLLNEVKNHRSECEHVSVHDKAEWAYA